MLSTAQVKYLYDNILAGNGTIKDAEQDDDWGPPLKAWRDSLEKGGANHQKFWGFASLGLKGQWEGEKDGEPSVLGWQAETLFGLMKSDPSWLLNITAEIRELGTWAGVAQTNLAFNPDLVAPWVIRWDKENPPENGKRQFALTGDDLEADLDSMVSSLDEGSQKFQLIRKWIRFKIAELSGAALERGPGSAPPAKPPSRFGNFPKG